MATDAGGRVLLCRWCSFRLTHKGKDFPAVCPHCQRIAHWQTAPPPLPKDPEWTAGDVRLLRSFRIARD